MYQPRTYRQWVRHKDLVTFQVMVEETDCYISAVKNLQSKARKLILKHRDTLKKFIAGHPLFLTTLEPLPVDESAPLLVKAMCEASARVGVGPMASVAGAIAEFVGKEILPFSPELIIENGGDIFLRSLKNRLVGIYAGDSPFSGKLGIELEGRDAPHGISTSSGTVGHSLSFGKADAVVVLAESATLSDAAATAIGNMIIQASDISKGIDFAKGVDGLKGIVIIKDDSIGAWGDVKLCKTEIRDGATSE